ncbi:proto-oncogene Mas-like [Neopsephotus bourkii]|uniref:proto-oncogene Mas-like n=1 Tax=Neopsephotus bourkii TaxID=309878 RepID=UPI002AA56AC8|nr:proto-oncogene Mas-like [Neopsephotus bourkii]
MVICVFGMVGNGIVLWFLGFQMKQNHFTIYILNLAVADCCLLLLIFLVILGILNLKIICYDLHSVNSFFNNFVFILRLLCNFFVLTSLGLLTAISTERCVSVIFPVWYRCHRPKHLSGIMSGVLWAGVGLFILSYYVCSHFGERCYRPFGSVGIFCSVVLSLIMLISNVSVVMRLRCGSRRWRLGKLYVAVVLNIIFFFAFGMPYTVNAFLNLLYYRFLFPETVTLVLALLNSSINPVIYFLVGSCRQRRFRGSIQVALRRVFEEKERSKEESPAPEGIPMESTAQGPAGEGEA